MKFRRILLKLSGLALKNREDPGDTLSADMLEHFATEISAAHGLGVEVAVVLGAGNILHGSAFAKLNGKGSRVKGDYMGMLGTIINSMALQSKLEEAGIPTRLQSAVAMDQVAQIYIREKAISGLEDGKVLIFAGGTGNPYFTTDTAAALRAAEIGADAVFKGTNVDGVYTGDPHTDPASRLLTRLSFQQVIVNRYEVMDATAFTMCRDQRIPVHVFNIHEPGNLGRLLRGEAVGTHISVDDPA